MKHEIVIIDQDNIVAYEQGEKQSTTSNGGNVWLVAALVICGMGAMGMFVKELSVLIAAVESSPLGFSLVVGAATCLAGFVLNRKS